MKGNIVNNTPRRALPSEQSEETRSGGKAWIVIVVVLAVLVGGGVAAYVTGLADPLIAKIPFLPAQETEEPTPEIQQGEWPLTGVFAEITPRPAVVMEMENSPDARPLAGLESADLVVEEAAGEDTTRLCVAFHSFMPSKVSSLGTLTATNDPMWPSGFVVLRGEQSPADYEPDPEAVSPQPLATFDASGTGATAQRQGLLTTKISLSLPGGAQPTWDWNISAGQWMRSEGAQVVMNPAGGQLGFTNVIILGIEVDGGSSGDIPRANLVGEGKGIIASGQMSADITWKRDSQASLWQFFDATGEPVVLQAGSTWIHIVPLGLGSWSLS
ncbi:MAG: DUF3048 domain-containing protein [Propionibacteriaceae bacterium]|nr:DUF3048 domain-containing protein [Propionibacteriaceae bacterium]